MCGIAGMLDGSGRGRVRRKDLLHMVEALSHRGPDNQGTHLEGELGLGHRRLAVIDPSPAGHQPMISEDGKLVVCYNGTIYNHPKLKDELEKRGHRYRSQCDTETLLHGWEEWGPAVVDRLNGHFAFAMWDRRSLKLYLARDRFGTKPLYYTEQNGLWLFASEIKAIIAHPAYTTDLNYDALCEYFTFQNLFRFHTLFKDINLVPPANILTLEAHGGQLKRRPYWDYDFSRPDNTLTFAEATQETRRLLEQAVHRQLLADVPVGAYLSGGLDSGSIVSIASRDLPRMQTFTCGWHMGGVEGVEQSFDERVPAELMAYLFRTEHYQQVIGHSDSSWVIFNLVKHLEDLRLGMSYGNFYAARLASKFVKVCLAGNGGDELFGGYPWRYYRVASSLGKEEYFDAYYTYWQRLVPDERRKDFFTQAALGRMNDTDMKRVLMRVFTFNPELSFETPEDHIANSLYFEAKTFLHGALLVGDKLSMSHGLEERFPFLDNDLVEFAQKVPVRFKLRDLSQWKRQDENSTTKIENYYAEYDDGKNVLREALRGLVPKEVRDRKKQGFSSPDESWYRGPNLNFVRRLLLDRNALCHQFINPAIIHRTLEEHLNKRINHRLRIWSLLCFEIWLATYMDERVGLADTIAQRRINDTDLCLWPERERQNAPSQNLENVPIQAGGLV